MRAFLALPLPPSDAEVIAAMGDRCPVGRAVAEENIHLTLAFLGDMSKADLSEIHDAMGTIKQQAFSFSLSGIESLGGHGGHALALGTDGGAALTQLHDSILSRIHGAGVVLERRRFRPHVTFARLPGKMNSDEQARLGEFLKREGTMSLPDIPATQFTLYESVLTKTGAYYIPLEDYELQSENTPYPAT